MARHSNHYAGFGPTYGFPPVARYPDIACRPADNTVFFHEGRLGMRDAALEAKRICGRCNHRTECAEWALRVREPEGVWGGMTPDEREKALAALGRAKKRTRPGRPRKVQG